jgi:putative MATE family efflux protein
VIYFGHFPQVRNGAISLKKDMTSGKEWKLILFFTLPIMAGSFLQQLYNTVDGIVVGNFIGENAFAGVGTCAPLTFLFLAFSTGLSVGAGIIISQYFGAKRYGELNAAINTTIILMGAFGILLTAVGFFITPFLLKTVLSTPDAILPYAVTYFRIFCFGLIFQFIYNGISYALRGMGDSKATLYFLIITTVLNVILDVLFVVAFHWGVAGTAIATVISQFVCVSLSYVYLRKRYKFENTGRLFDMGMCQKILKLGIPTAIQQTIVSLGNTALQRLVNGFGEIPIAAYAAGNRINMLMFVPIFGFQSGLATFTGQNIGAGKLDRVRRGFRVTLIMAMSVSIAACVILYAFAPTVVTMFSLQGEALQLGVQQIRFFATVFCAFTYYMILGGVLQGSGDVVVQSIATLSALLVRVIAAYIAVNIGLLGYNAAWVTNPIGWIAAILITTIRYASGKWKAKAVIKAPASGAATDLPAAPGTEV